MNTRRDTYVVLYIIIYYASCEHVVPSDVFVYCYSLVV